MYESGVTRMVRPLLRTLCKGSLAEKRTVLRKYTCFCTLYSAKIQFEYFFVKDYTVTCQGGAGYDNCIRLY